jgi:hypothetical protein
MVCPRLAAERVRVLTDGHTEVIIDDRTLDKRVIEMLAAILVRQGGDATTGAPAAAKKPMSLRPSRRSRGPMRESRMKGA